MTPDGELLQRYARTHSEEAFAELVRRHLDLVYSAVRRRLNGDDGLAQDAAQAVFTDLARKAPSLSGRPSVAGWLYRSALFAATDLVRAESRRRRRELDFMRDTIGQADPELDWRQLRPVLDDAMLQLKDRDREALLLRYFENRPLSEVGAKLGLNENAARMRIDRALEKLRAVLARRGVATSSALAAVISAHAVEAAPAALGISLTGAALAVSPTAGSFAFLNFMNATQLKIPGCLLALTGGGALWLQHQAIHRLNEENLALRQQIGQMKANDEVPAADSSSAPANDTLTREQLAELLRLRGQVGMLRQQTNALAALRRENQRLQALTHSNEAQATQDDFKQAAIAKMSDARLLGLAELMYAQSNQGQVATNMSQLSQYLTNADSALTGTNNFELVQAAALSGVTNPGSILLMREVQTWQTASGTWARTYLFVDGHAEVHVEPSGNFDVFEQQHSAAP